MKHSTFDRARVHASDNRAVGHEGLVPPRVDSPMTGAGGLWTSAADLARFLEFQLGDGTIDGHRVLDPALMEEMHTVPPPHAGAPAGYALGVSRSLWRAGNYLDIFFHGGGGDGFLSALYWVPPLDLGVAVLTNSSDEQDLEDTVASDFSMTWSPSRGVCTATASSLCPLRSTSWSQTSTSPRLQTWPTRSKHSRSRRLLRTPNAGRRIRSSTAPDDVER